MLGQDELLELEEEVAGLREGGREGGRERGREGGRERGREGGRERGREGFRGVYGIYGCQNDGLDELGMMGREGGREGGTHLGVALCF